MSYFDSDFATQFREIRLKSGFKSLSQLSIALCDLGIEYEPSIFSHWQRGSRIPSDRLVVFTLIKLFVSLKGISSLDEANRFCQSSGCGCLVPREVAELSLNDQSVPFEVPRRVSHFVGRAKILTESKQKLIDGKTVLLTGCAGIGKTALAIELAHQVRDEFYDGVLWYRADTTKPMEILLDIGDKIGSHVDHLHSLQARAAQLRNALQNKRLLIIFDNADSFPISEILPSSTRSAVLITSQSQNYHLIYSDVHFHLEPLSETESLSLFQSILGDQSLNPAILTKHAQALGHLPLALQLSAKQMTLNSSHVMDEVDLCNLDNLNIYCYDNTNLLNTLEKSYSRLANHLQSFFSQLSLFRGADFSMSSISLANGMSDTTSRLCLSALIDCSLVEHSTNGRYRLHPYVREFAATKITSSDLHSLKLTRAYTQLIKRLKSDHLKRKFLSDELENILGLLELRLSENDDKSSIQIWELINTYIWDTGRWDSMEHYSLAVYKLALKHHKTTVAANCAIKELCWLYYWRGDLKKAEKWVIKGLEIGKEEGDEENSRYAKLRFAQILLKKSEFSQSEKLLLSSLHNIGSKTEIRNKNLKGEILLTLGHLFSKKENNEIAFNYYKNSLKTFTQAHEYEGKALAMFYLGVNQLKKNNFIEAENFFTNALDIDLSRNRKPGVAWCKLALSYIYKQSLDTVNYSQFNQDSKSIFESTGIDNKISHSPSEMIKILEF